MIPLDQKRPQGKSLHPGVHVLGAIAFSALVNFRIRGQLQSSEVLKWPPDS